MVDQYMTIAIQLPHARIRQIVCVASCRFMSLHVASSHFFVFVFFFFFPQENGTLLSSLTLHTLRQRNTRSTPSDRGLQAPHSQNK